MRDVCFAALRYPKEEWDEAQMTPYCSRCEEMRPYCHFCRRQAWATPPAWGLSSEEVEERASMHKDGTVAMAEQGEDEADSDRWATLVRRALRLAFKRRCWGCSADGCAR